MKKNKAKFNVYKITYIAGKEVKEFKGSTLAVSEKQAINNIKFRTGNDYYSSFSNSKGYDFRWIAERRFE